MKHGSLTSLKVVESPGFFAKISGTWKVLEIKVQGREKSWNLTNMPFVYRTPCVNKCMKYPCYVLMEQFLCYLWWTFCDGLYCHTVYTE